MSVPICEYMFIPLNWLEPGKIPDMVLEPPKVFNII